MADGKLNPGDFTKVPLPKSLLGIVTTLFARWRERYSGAVEIHFLNGEVQRAEWKVRERFEKQSSPEQRATDRESPRREPQ